MLFIMKTSSPIKFVVIFALNLLRRLRGTPTPVTVSVVLFFFLGASPGAHATGNLNTARYQHTATLLPDGRVLVAGGLDGRAGFGADRFYITASAELYDPKSGTWAVTGSLHDARFQHTATLLPNGKVLVAGGNTTFNVALASAELYDPAIGTWTATGSLNNARFQHTANLLPNGKVLVVFGDNQNYTSFVTPELYDPATGIWTLTALKALLTAKGCRRRAYNSHTQTLPACVSVRIRCRAFFRYWLLASLASQPASY
jgi:hypothetical protein